MVVGRVQSLMVAGLLFTFSCWLLARDCCQLPQAAALHMALSPHGSFLLQGWQKGTVPLSVAFTLLYLAHPG